MFRKVIAFYAPKLVNILELPGVKSIELTDVSRVTIIYLNLWLRIRWTCDQSKGKLPLDLRVQEPDWEMLGIDIDIKCLRELREQAKKYLFHSTNTFVFAKTSGVSHLGEDTIDRLVSIFQKNDDLWTCVDRDVVEHAYKHTKAGSPLRRVLVYGFCAQANKEDRERVMEMPSAFVVDVVERSLTMQGALRQMPTACEYHEHKTDEARKTCDTRVFPRRDNE